MSENIPLYDRWLTIETYEIWYKIYQDSYTSANGSRNPRTTDSVVRGCTASVRREAVSTSSFVVLFVIVSPVLTFAVVLPLVVGGLATAGDSGEANPHDGQYPSPR